MGRYTSTSTFDHPGDFAGNITIKITAKKGLDTKPYSYHPSENEILLDHHSKFKIHKVEQDKESGVWTVHAEQLL